MRQRKIGRFRRRCSCATHAKVLAGFSVMRRPAAARWHLLPKLGTAQWVLLNMQTMTKEAAEVLGWHRCLNSYSCLRINADHAVPGKRGVHRSAACRTSVLDM